MNQEDNGCRNFVLGVMLIILSVAAVFAALFVIWLNGGLNYTVAMNSTTAHQWCPEKFDASMIIISQQSQTVICLYGNGTLTNERIEERGR